MSLTPSVPNFKESLKSFWQRPEGKTGMIVLVGLIILGVYGGTLVSIADTLAMIMSDAVHMAVSAVILIALLYVVFNKTFQSAISNLFQNAMRWFTGWIIEIDPIGILQNTIDRMRDQNEKLSKAIAGCNGAKIAVQAQIQKNNEAIAHATSLKEQAEKQAAVTRDPLRQQRMQLDRTRELQEIGRKMHSNEKLTAILNQITKMYEMLCRFQNLAEFNIDNMQAEVSNAKQERAAILQAYKGLGFAQKLIKGDPEQLKMLNQSLEYLATDNANKLGEMEDFARYSEKYLTQMDLEQGASADDAEKMLSKYEQKLLSVGNTQTVPSMPVVDAVPVPRSNKNDNYF